MVPPYHYYNVHPQVCTVIQAVHREGAVRRDGRLLAGDQILEVNGEDLTQATHVQVRHCHACMSASLFI